MARYLVIVTDTTAKRYKLGKDIKPLTTARSRLYRTDSRLCLRNVGAEEELIIYDVDSTQPYGSGTEPLNPDETMALIDIAKRGGSRAITKLSDIKSDYILYGIVGVVIVYALLTGGI